MAADDDGMRVGPRVLVTGASGFLGAKVAADLAAAGAYVVGAGFRHGVRGAGVHPASADLRVAHEARQLVENAAPDVVVHAAAMTDLGECERAPDEARRAIVDATVNLVAALRPSAQTYLVVLSTDLVFDGEGAPYQERDAPAPLSVYGRMKLLAERETGQHPNALVLRLSLSYGGAPSHRATFVQWLISGMQRGETLRLFKDEYRTPLYVGDTSEALGRLVRLPERPTGVLHAAGPESLSRVEMGEIVASVYEMPDAKILETTRAAEGVAHLRPRDASLDGTRLWSMLGFKPRRFAEALRQARACPTPST